MEQERVVRQVRDIAEEYGLNFRREYSGRGMFGATCIGVVYDTTTEYADFWAALDPEVREVLGEPTTDSMGRGVIAYWRNIETGAGRF